MGTVLTGVGAFVLMSAMIVGLKVIWDSRRPARTDAEYSAEHSCCPAEPEEENKQDCCSESEKA